MTSYWIFRVFSVVMMRKANSLVYHIRTNLINLSFKGHVRLPPVPHEGLPVVKVVWSIQVFGKVSRKSKLLKKAVVEPWRIVN